MSESKADLQEIGKCLCKYLEIWDINLNAQKSTYYKVVANRSGSHGPSFIEIEYKNELIRISENEINPRELTYLGSFIPLDNNYKEIHSKVLDETKKFCAVLLGKNITGKIAS